MINFLKKEFNDLTKLELYAILKLRMEIFILEQHSFYLDLDDHDQQAMHVIGIQHSNAAVICYGRVTVNNSIAQIRRIWVSCDWATL